MNMTAIKLSETGTVWRMKGDAINGDAKTTDIHQDFPKQNRIDAKKDNVVLRSK